MNKDVLSIPSRDVLVALYQEVSSERHGIDERILAIDTENPDRNWQEVYAMMLRRDALSNVETALLTEILRRNASLLV